MNPTQTSPCPPCIHDCSCGQRPVVEQYQLGGTLLPSWNEYLFRCLACGAEGQRFESFSSARDSWEKKVNPEGKYSPPRNTPAHA